VKGAVFSCILKKGLAPSSGWWHTWQSKIVSPSALVSSYTRTLLQPVISRGVSRSVVVQPPAAVVHA